MPQALLYVSKETPIYASSVVFESFLVQSHGHIHGLESLFGEKWLLKFFLPIVVTQILQKTP